MESVFYGEGKYNVIFHARNSTVFPNLDAFEKLATYTFMRRFDMF